MKFYDAFINKHPDAWSVLNHITAYAGFDADWGDLRKTFLIGMVEYFRARMAASSVRRYMAMIKALLNDYKDDYPIPCSDYSSILSIRNEKSKATWLTPDELKLIEQYECRTAIEASVKADFLLGAYTGARHSDFKEMDELNIVDGMIMYISAKSKMEAIVPIKPVVYDLLKVENVEVTDVTFNNTIRSICKACGINSMVKLYKAGKYEVGEKWMFISSHTARRSFATNLYLLGCDLLSISKMMGHSNTIMTERYIVCGLREMSDKVMQAFA